LILLLILHIILNFNGLKDVLKAVSTCKGVIKAIVEMDGNAVLSQGIVIKDSFIGIL